MQWFLRLQLWCMARLLVLTSWSFHLHLMLISRLFSIQLSAWVARCHGNHADTLWLGQFPSQCMLSSSWSDQKYVCHHRPVLVFLLTTKGLNSRSKQNCLTWTVWWQPSGEGPLHCILCEQCSAAAWMQCEWYWLLVISAPPLKSENASLIKCTTLSTIILNQQTK